MLQQAKADDIVVATGETHTVEELVATAFAVCRPGLEEIRGAGPALIRPAEVDLLIGDNSKAKRVLGWNRR